MNSEHCQCCIPGDLDAEENMVRKKRRGPGLAASLEPTLTDVKQAKAKASKSAKKTPTNTDDATTYSTTAPLSGDQGIETGSVVPSSTSKKGAATGLDAEMGVVASKHGGSTKCLEGFQVPLFLEEPRDGVSRHSLGAKLRGATWL